MKIHITVSRMDKILFNPDDFLCPPASRFPLTARSFIGKNYFCEGSNSLNNGKNYFCDGMNSLNDGKNYFCDGMNSLNDGKNYFCDGMNASDDGENYFCDGMSCV